MNGSILEAVTAIVRGCVEIDPDKIHEGSRFKQDLGLTSLQFVTMLDKAEERFAVRISDEKLMEIRTIGDLVKSIEEEQRGIQTPCGE